jgi:hypothetical protein
MKASREEIEKFDAYIRGTMDSEERLLFESALATDETLASEFELHQLITEGITSEKEARFRAILAQQRQDTFIGNNTWGRKFTIASAAIVTLGFLVVLLATYRMNNPSNQLAKQDSELEDSKNNAPAEIEDRNKLNSERDKTKEYANDELREIPPDSLVPTLESKALEVADDAEETFDFKHDLESAGDANSNAAKPEMNEDENRRFDAEDDLDEVTIAKDRLLSKETVQIKQLDYVKMAPISTQSNVSLDKAEVKKVRAKSRSVDNVATSADLAPVDSAVKANKEKLRVELRDSVSKQEKAERISVEYYKSPLNYKGYNYDERLKKIIVYGLKETKSTLLKYQNVLYLKNGTDYYKMIPTTQYLRFNKLTDQNLISTLSQ